MLTGQAEGERMKVQGAVVRGHGSSFAVVRVNRKVLDNLSQAHLAVEGCCHLFPAMPVVLVAQDSRGAPRYYGPEDYIQSLAEVPAETITWREYSLPVPGDQA